MRPVLRLRPNLALCATAALFALLLGAAPRPASAGRDGRSARDASQDPAKPTAEAAPLPLWVADDARFAFQPPPGWRTLTPDEGRLLRARGDIAIPDEFVQPEPPRYLVFGPIEQWLAGTFDGRVLTVLEIDGEPEVGPSGVAGIKAHWQGMAAHGIRVSTERLEVGAVGKDAHPALLGKFRVDSGGRRHARFDAYVPSGGGTFTFALTWPEDDLSAGEATFAAVQSSIAMASTARGSVNLGSKLLWAGLLGLGIGVVLHSVRKRARG